MTSTSSLSRCVQRALKRCLYVRQADVNFFSSRRFVVLDARCSNVLSSQIPGTFLKFLHRHASSSATSTSSPPPSPTSMSSGGLADQVGLGRLA